MTLDEVQDLMEDLYGPGDRERGMPATVAWLCEELGELAQAARKGTKEQQLHELGDVLAWLASLANQLDLTLDDAMARYRENPPLYHVGTSARHPRKHSWSLASLLFSTLPVEIRGSRHGRSASSAPRERLSKSFWASTKRCPPPAPRLRAA